MTRSDTVPFFICLCLFLIFWFSKIGFSLIIVAGYEDTQLVSLALSY